MSCEDQPRSDRPSTSRNDENLEKVRDAINADRRRTDANGIVHKEFVPLGQTVNQQFDLKVLKRLCDSVWKKRPEMWRSGNWFLHHDNAPAHMALSVQQFLPPKKKKPT
jgi:hypothetical protein